MNKVSIEDGNATDAGVSASSQPVPEAIASSFSHGVNASGIDLNAETQKFEKKLLELQQEEDLLRHLLN